MHKIGYLKYFKCVVLAFLSLKMSRHHYIYFFLNRIINRTNINACFIWTSLAPSPNVMGELIHPFSPWKKERLMAGNRWLSLISIGSLTPNTKPTSDVICQTKGLHRINRRNGALVCSLTHEIHKNAWDLERKYIWKRNLVYNGH